MTITAAACPILRLIRGRLRGLVSFTTGHELEPGEELTNGHLEPVIRVQMKQLIHVLQEVIGIQLPAKNIEELVSDPTQLTKLLLTILAGGFFQLCASHGVRPPADLLEGTPLSVFRRCKQHSDV